MSVLNYGSSHLDQLYQNSFLLILDNYLYCLILFKKNMLLCFIVLHKHYGTKKNKKIKDDTGGRKRKKHEILRRRLVRMSQ